MTRCVASSWSHPLVHRDCRPGQGKRGDAPFARDGWAEIAWPGGGHPRSHAGPAVSPPLIRVDPALPRSCFDLRFAPVLRPLLDPHVCSP